MVDSTTPPGRDRNPEAFPVLGEDQIDKRPYHPHMTVGFKDLKPYYFYRAWDFFSEQSYERQYEVDAIYLLKHNGREWEVMKRFGFEPK